MHVLPLLQDHCQSRGGARPRQSPGLYRAHTPSPVEHTPGDDPTLLSVPLTPDGLELSLNWASVSSIFNLRVTG